MKIIFMGTPEFAAPSLTKLLYAGHEVTAVFTQRPKAKGRGMNEAESPVHICAKKHSIPVYTPKTLRNEEVFSLLQSIEADVIVVVAYGFIIPENILQLKKYGCLNVHPSLLPRHRGAAPLQRTIIEGDKETAVCIMQMDAGLDTGDIILMQQFQLTSTITLPELHDQCSHIGAELLVKVLADIDTLPRIKQSEEGITYAHKLTKEEGYINWHDSAFVIDCKIRGMNPWPGVYFEYQGKLIKILAAECDGTSTGMQPGTVIDDGLKIACGKGSLSIKKLQQPGKTVLTTSEFLKGTKIPAGIVLN